MEATGVHPLLLLGVNVIVFCLFAPRQGGLGASYSRIYSNFGGIYGGTRQQIDHIGHDFAIFLHLRLPVCLRIPTFANSLKG
jgi:hypothetical protein